MNPKGGVVLSDIFGPEGGAADLAALLGISDRKVRELAAKVSFLRLGEGFMTSENRSRLFTNHLLALTYPPPLMIRLFRDHPHWTGCLLRL